MRRALLALLIAMSSIFFTQAGAFAQRFTVPTNNPPDTGAIYIARQAGSSVD